MITLNSIWFWGSSSWAWGSEEYHIIAITTRPSQPQSSSTCQNQIDLLKLYLIGILAIKVKLASIVKGKQKAPFSIATTLSLDCSTLLLICTLYCWVFSKEVSNTIFKVFDMTRPGIEPRSPGSLATTLLARLMSRLYLLGILDAIKL